MRVLVYGGSIRPGGGLTVLRGLLEQLSHHRDMQVDVLIGAEDTAQSLARDLPANAENLKLHRFMRGAPSLLRYLLSKLMVGILAWRRQADLVISINYFLPVPCRLMVYHINLLHFDAESSPSPRSFPERLKDLDARLACRLSAINVFESQYLFDAASKRTSGRIRNPWRLYIGVDPSFFAAGTAVDAGPELLAVTSMQPHKDNGTLLAALKELIQRAPQIDWKLQIAGGQSKAQWLPLEQEAERLGIRNHVQVLGPVGKTELAGKMRSALCLISTSRVESFCMVAVEAMAAGCATVVADSSSMPESVDGAALLAAPGDARRFAEAAHELHQDPGLRLRLQQAGLERAKRLTWTAFGRNLMKIINSPDSALNTLRTPEQG